MGTLENVRRYTIHFVTASAGIACGVAASPAPPPIARETRDAEAPRVDAGDAAADVAPEAAATPATKKLLARTDGEVTSLVAHGNDLYAVVATNKITRVPKAGGGAVVVFEAPVPTSIGEPVEIVDDGNALLVWSIYVQNWGASAVRDSVVAAGNHYSVISELTEVPWDGGAPVRRFAESGTTRRHLLATSGCGPAWVAGRFTYITSSPLDSVVRSSPPRGAALVVARRIPGATSLAGDATHFYWTQMGTTDPLAQPPVDAGAVARAPCDGGAASKLVEPENVPVQIRVDDAYVYFMSGGKVMKRAPKTGGPAVTILDTAIDGYVLGARHLYWTKIDGVFRANKDGSGSPALVVAHHDADVLAVDDEAVYFSDPHGIWSAPLPP